MIHASLESPMSKLERIQRVVRLPYRPGSFPSGEGVGGIKSLALSRADRWAKLKGFSAKLRKYFFESTAQSDRLELPTISAMMRYPIDDTNTM